MLDHSKFSDCRVNKISPRTEENYKRLFESRLATGRKRRRISSYRAEDLTIMEIVEDLRDDISRLKKKTVTTYKCAIMYSFTDLQNQYDSSDERWQKFEHAKIELTRLQHAHTEYKKSHQIFRGIPEVDLRKILALLATGNSRNGRIGGENTAHYLMATIATGLRPAEWKTAKIVEISHPETYPNGLATHALEVECIKIKREESRNLGPTASPAVIPRRYEIADAPKSPTRTIPIVESDLDIVTRHIDSIKNYGIENFARYQRTCSRSLNRACSSLFRKKRYNFYSARSQYIANMKNIHTLVDVQKFCGHSVGSGVTMKSYGRASAGHKAYKEQRSQRQSQSLGREEVSRERVRG